MARQGTPIVISAPSGAGKTSLVAALLKDSKHLKVSVSHTTRPMRPGEVDGVNYHFVTLDEFEEKINANDFIEHAKVFNNYYGTSQSSLNAELANGYDVILEIDWQGAEQVRSLFPEAISIFIFPPSLEVLEQRLHQRGQDDANIIKARMDEAHSEISHHQEFDYLVINDDFDQALLELKVIVAAAPLTRQRMMVSHRDIIKKMM